MLPTITEAPLGQLGDFQKLTFFQGPNLYVRPLHPLSPPPFSGSSSNFLNWILPPGGSVFQRSPVKF